MALRGWKIASPTGAPTKATSNVSLISFLPIASPARRRVPPNGPGWIHEVKFDGFRVQIHKRGRAVRLYSRNGKDCTDRYPGIVAAVTAVPGSFVIDGELVACDEADAPDFHALLRRRAVGLCVWCFDILKVGRKDLRRRPLIERRFALASLIRRTGDDRLRFSESFDDGERLLAAAAERRLEGIVSKPTDSPYRAGPACGWIKVQSET